MRGEQRVKREIVGRAACKEGDRERRGACGEGDRAKAVSPTMVSIMRERESIGSRKLGETDMQVIKASLQQ